MRKIKTKISAILLIWILSISNIFANGWIPDEPMVIYWSISWNSSNNLKIFDWNNKLLKETIISSGNYWTKKTFSSDKIRLDNFSGELIFKVWEEQFTISKWETDNCEDKPIFQKWNICEYNLEIKTSEDTNNSSSSTSNSTNTSTNNSNTSNSTSSNTSNNSNSTNTSNNNTPKYIIWNIKTDNLVISEEYKTNDINEIFKWRILENKKSIIKSSIWENILKNVWSSDKVIITSNKLEISKKINKKIILLNSTKKEAVYIPEDTEMEQTDVIIEEPVKIENISNIKRKINKKILWAVEIPTNKRINFKKDIRICTELITNNQKALKVYYSHDNVNWTIDNDVKNLEISNWQVCFDVNHLTSFAVWEDEDIVNNKTSSSSRSSWWYSKTKDKTYNLVENRKETKKNNYESEVVNSEEEIEIVKYVEINEPIYKENKTNNKNYNYIEKYNNNINLSEQNKNDILINKSNLTFFDKFEWTNFIDFNGKMKSKDYIKNLVLFNKNKKIEENVSWYKILKIKWDEAYNKQIDLFVIKIFNEIKLKPIRESMFNHLNKMTKSYWILNYNTLKEKERWIYKSYFYVNLNNYKFKLKKLKKKDEIIRRTLEKRRIAEKIKDLN